MNRFFRILIPVLILSVTLSCGEDDAAKRDTSPVTGQWNTYEMGTQAEGFVPGTPRLLASSYGSGLTFFGDGTYAYRLDISSDGSWIETPVMGTYELKDKTIELTSSPGTPDEKIYILEIIKLNANQLWIHDKFWSSHATGDNEPELHLERVD